MSNLDFLTFPRRILSPGYFFAHSKHMIMLRTMLRINFYLDFSGTFSRPDQKCLQAAVKPCVELSLFQIVVFFDDDDNCLSIAMMC